MAGKLETHFQTPSSSWAPGKNIIDWPTLWSTSQGINCHRIKQILGWGGIFCWSRLAAPFFRGQKKRNPLHKGFISNQQFTNSQAYWDTAASYHDEVMLRSHAKASRSQIWTFLPHWEVPVWMLTSVQVRNTCWWTISTPLLIISRLPLPPGSQALAIKTTSIISWKLKISI